MTTQGRNDKCSCGSGKKYKQCCMVKNESDPASNIKIMSSAGDALAQDLQTAMVHYQAGRFSEARAICLTITKRLPSHPDALFLLGLMAYDSKEYEEAFDCVVQAKSLHPSNPFYLNLLGKIHFEKGEFGDAIISHRMAITLKSDFAEAYNNLGTAYKKINNLQAAVDCYRKAITIKPNYANAYYNLGTVLFAGCDFDGAINNFQKAIHIDKNLSEAHYNLGLALHHSGRIKEAETCYRQTILFKPDHAEAYGNLGITLQESVRIEEAEICYRKAMALNPEAFEYAYMAELIMPIIHHSSRSILEWRNHYLSGIDKLKSIDHKFDDLAAKFTPRTFFLAYHNRNDRQLMAAQCQLFRDKAPSLNFVASHIPAWQPSPGRRIRIGFCSMFMVNHTIGHLYQGLLQHLDRSRFEVILYHAPNAKRDAFSKVIDRLAERVCQLPPNLSAQQKMLGEESLDVLFYPDIGMTPSTYYLAYSRFAPVQIVSWGHPSTTGIDTLDYYISAASIEPADADEHYSERLIRFNRLPCFYRPVALTETITRVTLGLPETGTLYGCPQSLFKFHPDFDAILAEIAAGDPSGHIVLIEGLQPAWSKLLKERWQRSFPILSERVIFLKRQPRDRFLALLQHFDLLLDPIYFGSGNTLYEAMTFGTPIVTFPGEFMRGRIVAGAYRQMGLKDAPIATRLEDYAPLALTLGRNVELRNQLRQESLQAAKSNLFSDRKAIDEFEQFIVAAVDAASRGGKVGAGWQTKRQAKDLK